MDLVVNLSHDGIRLIFDPVSQRLKVMSGLMTEFGLMALSTVSQWFPAVMK